MNENTDSTLAKAFSSISVEEESTGLNLPNKTELKPDTIYFRSHAIAFCNTGNEKAQEWIDTHRKTQAATFGGSKYHSGSDNRNTHFIGHNPGAFSPFTTALVGEEIAVTDANKKVTRYTIKKISNINDQGIENHTYQNLMADILEPGTHERITLQTCESDSLNTVIFAAIE
jgi:hypothetical protein